MRGEEGMEPPVRRVRRSLIFVPGSEPRKLAKARVLGADALILDLEDAVAPDRVQEARRLVREFLDTADAGGQERTVRVHGTRTPEFFEDVRAIVPGRPDAILLPKTNTPQDVLLLDGLLAGYEGQVGLPRGHVRLLPIVETALGLVNAFAIAGASPRVDGLILGHADLALTLGVQERMALQGIIFHARCQLVVAAKAAGREAYDIVYLQIQDLDGLRAEALEGLRMGFDGKLLVHPSQIGPVHEVYTPTLEQVEFARRVIEGHEAVLREGRAVFTVDGRMIDLPIVDVERKILQRAQKAGLIPAGVAGPTPRG